MRCCFLLLLILHVCSTLGAQPDLNDLELVDSIRVNYIRTVEFRNTNNELGLPIMNLRGERLVCEFDDSYGDYIDYYYTIKHCDRNWNFTDNAEVSEYLEGPEELQIEQFQSSVNTQLNYTHFSFSFPNQDIQFIWSGNYILIIYDEEGTIVVTRRFYVVDDQVPLMAKQEIPQGTGTYDTHQAFQVQADLEILDPLNPMNEIFVTSFQNRFNENNSPFISPLRVDRGKAVFDIRDQISFPGIKEFRFFDSRNVLLAGENVQAIDVSNEHMFLLLELDKKRDIKPYIFRKESNGAFVLRNADRDTGEKDITSEYPHIIFTLKSPFPENGEVYVVGAFNDFKIHEDFRMEYLDQQGAYSLEVPMKQGFYNYLYALKREGEPLDIYALEGNSYETENEYHIFAYYKPIALKYDQLVGYTFYHMNSR